MLFEKARVIPQTDWLPVFGEIVGFYREEYPSLTWPHKLLFLNKGCINSIIKRSYLGVQSL